MNINISHIFLMLGNECNLQCKYCLQHDIVEDQVVHEINPDIYSYVSKIARYQRKPLHITFFGGEPLIFWHQIEQFVTRLECQNITFGIISNGVALTEDRVAWLNQHNIRFALSWDGDNVMETRGFDAVRDRRNLLLKLNRLSLTGVVSGANYPKDFVDAVDKFDAEYCEVHAHHLPVNMDLIMDNCGNCGDLVEIDYDKWREQIKELCDWYYQIQKGIVNKPSCGEYLISKLLSHGKYVPKDNMNAKCRNGVSVLNIDMKGDLFLCHNTHTKVGSIYDPFLATMKRAMLLDPTQKNYEHSCKDCSVQRYCKNGCMLMDQETRDRYYCELARATYEPVEKLRQNLLNEGFDV